MKGKAVVENGFKETEIGLIPEDWQVKGFEECIDKERISRDIKIPQGKYKKVGRYPIVDQGASFIAGYTDDKSKLYSGCLPVIVFGDHTRIFKFVDFSFSLGADGIKLIQPKDFLNPKYFYYYLCSLTIESKGYNRHYKYLKEKIIAFPEKTEQQKIAFVLSKIQQAIEQQHKIIETTRELKKSLMNKLFTEGLHGEEQKETEIGLMPKSWKVVDFADCLSDNKIKVGKIKQQDFKPIGKYPVVDQGQKLIAGYSNDKSKVYQGDLPIIIFGDHTRILKYIDFLFICGADGTKVILPKKELNAKFFFYTLLNIEIPSRGYNRHYHLLKEKKFPIPPLQEQKEIANILLNVDKKISQAESKKQTLQALFKTMLNQLMTGKVRVKDFDFEVN
jgi:type I restriction enzyme S subunit